MIGSLLISNSLTNEQTQSQSHGIYRRNSNSTSRLTMSQTLESTGDRANQYPLDYQSDNVREMYQPWTERTITIKSDYSFLNEKFNLPQKIHVAAILLQIFSKQTSVTILYFYYSSYRTMIVRVHKLLELISIVTSSSI
jgi:hypothetical protein